MPMRNRVAPTGEIVAVPLRGAWCGNRGILHRGTDVVRTHASDLWITCRLSFKDWRLPQWAPGHFTLLFFHDEAVSPAARHRPCPAGHPTVLGRDAAGGLPATDRRLRVTDLTRRCDHCTDRRAVVPGPGHDRPCARPSPTGRRLEPDRADPGGARLPDRPRGR